MADTPLEELASIERSVEELFRAALDEDHLRAISARFTGREGSLTRVMKRIPELPGPERKSFGQRVNAVKSVVEASLEGALHSLKSAARERELNRPMLDITLPGRPNFLGRLHPITRTLHDIVDVFTALGFEVAEGPEVDLAENNFERLGFPKDHPAMDMHDSFFLADSFGASLLRTHTSTVQIREMLSHPPPVQIIAPGAVFRRDDDVTHSPMFFQLEGLVVDRGVTMRQLKGVLGAFVARMFGPTLRTRFRASFFPFVEPGAELDMECLICGARDPGCRVCKGTGWLEVLGCGMVHPVVFENVGYDPEAYTGFAFGLGIDRIAMLRYDINDIRHLYENDLRFLASL